MASVAGFEMISTPQLVVTIARLVENISGPN